MHWATGGRRPCRFEISAETHSVENKREIDDFTLLASPGKDEMSWDMYFWGQTHKEPARSSDLECVNI